MSEFLKAVDAAIIDPRNDDRGVVVNSGGRESDVGCHLATKDTVSEVCWERLFIEYFPAPRVDEFRAVAEKEGRPAWVDGSFEGVWMRDLNAFVQLFRRGG